MGDPTALTTDLPTVSAADGTVAVLGLATPAALQQLRDGVLFLLRKELRDFARADDLCNETFRIVLERLPRQPLEDPARLASYLAQTARNLVIEERRKTGRRRTVTGHQSEIENEPDPREDAAALLDRQAHAAAVRKILQELPNLRDRELLVRAYLHDQDPEQICRELRIDPDNYRKVVHRARERFRALLEKRRPLPDLYGLAFI